MFVNEFFLFSLLYNLYYKLNSLFLYSITQHLNEQIFNNFGTYIGKYI